MSFVPSTTARVLARTPKRLRVIEQRISPQERGRMAFSEVLFKDQPSIVGQLVYGPQGPQLQRRLQRIYMRVSVKLPSGAPLVEPAPAATVIEPTTSVSVVFPAPEVNVDDLPTIPDEDAQTTLDRTPLPAAAASFAEWLTTPPPAVTLTVMKSILTSTPAATENLASPSSSAPPHSSVSFPTTPALEDDEASALESPRQRSRPVRKSFWLRVSDTPKRRRTRRSLVGLYSGTLELDEHSRVVECTRGARPTALATCRLARIPEARPRLFAAPASDSRRARLVGEMNGGATLAGRTKGTKTNGVRRFDLDSANAEARFSIAPPKLVSSAVRSRCARDEENAGYYVHPNIAPLASELQ
ncbi:uncharacterized protein BXZ73DRAFT_76501 [Epithele typhae]|uniref:uncharacterized protein n=1 Tax=Epithele typhae TaxID=378194 RepID=UPI002007BD4F|nr:uncharacterized protein BXZ73DRAFT_76501 [Epithele typhae]KAH9937873.1 hypothetical protein BXZ73DRAFT_76501 [Epithele typhae]